MFSQLGVIIDQIDFSQECCEIVDSLNTLATPNYNISPVIFTHNPGLLYRVATFPVMGAIDAYNYSGTLIALSIRTANIAIECIQAKKRFFFIQNMEWIYDINCQFNKYASIYLNPKIELLTRHLNHTKVIEDAWRSPLATIEDLTDENFLRLVR